MKPRQRHEQIIEMLLDRGSVGLHELCESFQCSGGTIRNDLRYLEQQGKLIRTFAGATIEGIHSSKRRLTATPEDTSPELGQAEMIARRAAEMVRDGDTILIYPGPLTRLMSDRLMTLKALTVVTTSLDIARRFSHNPNYSVLVIGGQMHFDSDVLDGSAGMSMLNGLRANKAFIPCDGISSAQGYACNDVTGAQMRAAMMNCAQTVITLAMPEAISHSALVSFAALNQAHHCITTADASNDMIALLRAAGVRVSQCSDRLTEVRAENPPDRVWRIGFANLVEGEDFSVSIRQSIEQAAQQRGNIELTLANNDCDPDLALLNARRLIDARVDLVIEFQLYERTNHAIMDLFRLANIPVIAIDIPMPGAVFFGADNYRAGRMAGEAAVVWIRKHWHGQLDKVVCIQQSFLGPLPAGRIHGQLDALREAFNTAPKDIIEMETQHGMESLQSAATQALRNIPWGKKVLFVGIDAGMAMAAMAAAEALDRQQHTAVVSQNVTTRIRRELEHHNPMLVGAIEYYQEQYGNYVVQMALDMLEGRPVPPAVYTTHKLITADDLHPANLHEHRNGKARKIAIP